MPSRAHILLQKVVVNMPLPPRGGIIYHNGFSLTAFFLKFATPMRTCIPLYFLFIVITGCGVSRSSFSAGHKYSPEQLQKDFSVYETLLEQTHPGLYWYTPKDSMQQYF